MTDSLSGALATLRRRYGPQALHRGDAVEPMRLWPAEIGVIDGVLTRGGLPRGRVTVLAAAQQAGASGRLTLLQALMAAASRRHDAAYVDLTGGLDPGFLADLGADLDACLAVSPGAGQWGRGFAMARSLVGAGLPWIALALGPRDRPHVSHWEHALAALAETVAKRDAVAVVAAPAPLAAPLAHVSSLTLTCAPAGWHRANGDVAGLRVRITVSKSKLGAPGAEALLLLRYPRPYAAGEVVALPSVLPAATPQVDIAALAAAAQG